MRASEARLAEAQRLAKIGSWELDIANDRLVWSDEVYRMFQVDPATFGASSAAFLDAIHPDDRQRVSDAYESSLVTREPYEITHRLRMADGSIKWVHERCETTFDSSGRPLRSIGTVQDITERYQFEQAMRDSELRYRKLFETSPDAILVLDSAGRVRSANEAAARMHDYRVEELIGKRIQDLCDPDGAASVPGRMRKIAAGDSLMFEVLHRRKDGSYFPVEVVATTMRIGEETFFLSFDRDISDRKSTEAQLRRREELFRLVWDNAADGMRLTDAEGTVVAVNPAYCRMVGRTREEIEGRPLADVYATADRPFITQDYLKHFTHRKFLTFSERKMTLFDGREIWLELSSRITPEAAGEPLLITVFRDITSRKLAESALNIHSEILLNMSDGVTFIDKQGLIRLANRALDHMFGYESGELIGRHATVLHDATAEETGRIVAQIIDSIAATGNWNGELRCRRKDGAVFWTSTRISRLEQPGATSFISVQEDITARKKRDEMLAALREQLAHASRLGTLGEMATGLAHELNQPLTALHLYASIGLTLGEKLEHPQLKSCLQKISDESLRAGEIIRRIRSFAARAPARHVPLDLNGLIHEVLAILSLELRQKEVSLALELQPDLPSIRADSIHIQQVLVNLIRNALEAMSQTPAERRSLRISTASLEHEVRVGVQDSGCGFEPAAAAELFEAFHTTKPAGLGLGLAISRSLIEAYGGRIAAEPHSTGGATFYFDLPVALTE